MGAWNSHLLGNDSIQDILISLEDEEPSSFIRQYHKQALAESKTFLLSEDELPLEYKDDEKESLLFNSEQSTEARRNFLGLLCHGLENDKQFLAYFDYSHVQDALNMLKQLCHKQLLSEYVDPEDRFNELYKFKQQLKRHFKL